MRSTLTSSSRRSPKHRLEKPVTKRPLLLSIIAVGACTVVAGLAATNAGDPGAPAFGAIRAAETEAAPAPEPTPVATKVVAGNGASAGPVTGGTTVTVHGADLSSVSTVKFGGKPGTVVAVTDDAVTIKTPPAAGLETGTVPVKLFDVNGDPVVAKAPATPVSKPAKPAESGKPTPSAGPMPTPKAAPAPTPARVTEEPAAPASPAPTAEPSAAPATAGLSAKPLTLTFRYLPDPHVTAQIDYVLAHWNDYNRDEFGAIPGNDCVNFTSQSLLARGWKMDDEWSFNRDTFQSTTAWTSSTALAAYLAEHPERATALSDDERSKVKVGDVVQFDWDNSGDRDHTGIVTKVETTDAGTVIRFAGHTADTDYASVDDAIAGGGSVSYWSIR
ncbi:amidase domain-containing protein [Cryobacterium tepidiphilum]|uniref:CHAP domain-containing protein n=1 Tax=Cryobacterium tepidiphilum TaxID=2486026 RepID=A0A3M8KTZ1_9MICO|nr:amidase domain-containing protein [Cryobacterium tepidiphilum]RNE56771.1 CHAP domain-containing protein [Cryobacterium tepidiphilum]